MKIRRKYLVRMHDESYLQKWKEEQRLNQKDLRILSLQNRPRYQLKKISKILKTKKTLLRKYVKLLIYYIT